MKLLKSVPYIDTLLIAPPSSRVHLLRSFPAYVIDDIVEILYNVVMNNVNVHSSHISKLSRHKNALNTLIRARRKHTRQKVMYKQNGGFLGAVIPIIAGVVSELLG